MTLPVDEFLSRFLLHVLPRGFVRIRHYGFLSSRRRRELVPLCQQLLADAASPPTPLGAPTPAESVPLWTCPLCGAPITLIERLTAAQIKLRSPPQVNAAWYAPAYSSPGIRCHPEAFTTTVRALP